MFSATHRSIRDYIPPSRWSEGAFTSKFVDHPFLPYALKSLYHDRSLGRAITVNEHGFRDLSSTPRLKPPQEFRVACIGGSTVFGMGGDTASWPASLERSLSLRVVNSEGPGDTRTIKVLNFGVEGYTSHSDLIQLALRVVSFSPDSVIVYSGINDVKLWGAENPLPDGSHAIQRQILTPQGIQRHLPGWLLNHSGLIAVGTRLFDRVILGVEYGHLVMTWPFKTDASSPAKGSVYFESNLRSIVGLARAHGVTPILSTIVTHPALPPGELHAELVGPIREVVNPIIRKVARDMTVDLVDPASDTHLWEAHLFIDGVHLSDEGNDLLAQYFSARIGNLRLPAPSSSTDDSRGLD